MNLEELRKHIRKIISEEIYSDKGNGVNYEALKNEFLEAVKKNGRKIDNDGSPLRELEGSAIVSGTEHFFVFDYVVTSRKYEFEDGDGYYTPRFAVGGHFKFDITGTEVCDDDWNTICDFDGVANLIDGGYDLIKEWFDFDESVEFEGEDYSVNEEINEFSPHEKVRNEKNVERFFRKGDKVKSGIRTIAVMTSDNPDSVKSTNSVNKKYRHSLVSDLKNGGYVYMPAKGKFGNTENSYAIFNISLDTVKVLCGRYQQTSFVYSVLNNDGTIHSEYWEKANPSDPYNKESNDYIKKDECDTWEDMSQADDYFTVIGNKFKYSIPFPMFNEVNETICKNLQQLEDMAKTRWNSSMKKDSILEHTIHGVGQSPYLWRKAVNKGCRNY